MADKDLRGFLDRLEQRGLLRRIAAPVSIVHEMTEIHRRVLKDGGPALLFETPVGPEGQRYDMPVVANLFGTQERIALGFGTTGKGMSQLAELLAFLRQPEPSSDFRSMLGTAPAVRAALAMGTRPVWLAPAQAAVRRGRDIDLGQLPIQWCWPGDHSRRRHAAAAIVAPPVPAFYLQLRSIDDIIDSIAARAIDVLDLGIEAQTAGWAGLEQASRSAL